MASGILTLNPQHISSLTSQIHLLRAESEQRFDHALQHLHQPNTFCSACVSQITPYQELIPVAVNARQQISILCELVLSSLASMEKQNQRYTALEIQHDEALLEIETYHEQLSNLQHKHQLERKDSEEKTQQLQEIVQELKSKNQQCVREWEKLECRRIQTEQARQEKEERTHQQYQHIINQQYQLIQKLKTDQEYTQLEILGLKKQVQALRTQLYEQNTTKPLSSVTSSRKKVQGFLTLDDDIILPDTYEVNNQSVVGPSQALSDQISQLESSIHQQMKKISYRNKSILTQTSDSHPLIRIHSSQQLFKHSFYSNELLCSENQKMTKSTGVLPELSFKKKSSHPIQPLTRAINKIHNFLHDNIVSRRIKIKKQ